ncbi:MAG: DUF1835 domain-containing protein [Bacteroidota bacterium]
MATLLNITNGDCFTERLKSLPYKGEIITWREMLCEGKTLSNVGSESFWKTRFEFLNKNYSISKSWFVEKTLKEYRTLCNHKQEDRIVLWFEYDLFCQINMLAILSWLKTHRRYAEISLVCSGRVEGSDEYFGLNELSDEALAKLYQNKIVLTQDDLEYADYVWQLYCSDNPMHLQHVINDKAFQFDYLNNAIQGHLQRFPSIKNGLNALENQVLEVALAKKPKSKKEFTALLLKTKSVYGFGHSQYDRMVNTLKPLFSSLNPVRLSAKGKEVIAKKTNFYAQMRDADHFLGGALKYGFLYNTETNRILKL